MVQLAEYLYHAGVEVVLVVQREDPEGFVPDPGIRIRVSDLSRQEQAAGRIRNFIRRFRKLRNIWKEEKPDVILSFIGKNNVMTILTSLGLSIPAAVAVRGDPEMEYPAGSLRKAAMLLFPLAKGVILQTKKSRSFFPERIRKKCRILPNPLDASFTGEPYGGERERSIVCVGRIDENKNQRMLMEAFSRVAGEMPDLRLRLIGDGPQRRELEICARELPHGDRIFFEGSVSDVPDRIRRAGVFVLCSDTEGLPNALIEAMAMGLPVIATDCPSGGPAELIRQHENGILIPVRDKKALESALREILEDPCLAQRLGKEAAKIRIRYNAQTALEEWKTYLEEICGGRQNR